MRKLLLMTILFSTYINGYSQKIESFVTPEFKTKPQIVFVYIGVSDKLSVNEMVMNRLQKELPNNVFIKKQLLLSSAWVESPDVMLKNALKNENVDAVLICNTLDTKEPSNTVVNINLLPNSLWINPFVNSNEYRYEMKIIDFKSNSIIYKAVSEPTSNTFYAYKFVRKAIEDRVL